MISVTYIPCLFEDTRYEFSSHNKTVFAILQSLVHKFPELKKEAMGFQVRVNGKLISPFKWRTKLEDGDRVYLIQTPGGEAIVAILVAVGVFASAATATVAGISLAVIINVGLFVLSIAYSIYSICAAKKTTDTAATGLGLTGSKSYGWEGAALTAEPGIPVPVVYGEHLVAGNIISSFVTSDGNYSYLNLLINLCEGPIEGIMKEDETGVCTSIIDAPYILINDNLMSNLYTGDPTYGYAWYWDYRLGEDVQSLIPGFLDTKMYYDMGSPEVSVAGGAITYTTDGDDIQAAEVRLRIPALYVVSGGNYIATPLWFAIYYRIHNSGDPWITALATYISESTQYPIRRAYTIVFPAAGRYDIKVERVSGDFDGTTQVGKLYWDSVTEIIYKSYTYPLTALLALKLLATEKLSAQLPNVKVLIRGKKVLNLKTSVVEWSKNPVYCVNDFLTNERYGAGRFITSSNINTDRMIEEADYCDEQVGDGHKYTGAGITVTATSLTDPNHTFVASDVGRTICCESPTDSTVYTRLAITSVAGTTANGTGGWVTGTPDPATVGWEFGENRYELDLIIDTQDDALTLISQICGSFRAVPLWIKDAIELIIDRPRNPCYQVNMSNIISSSFQNSFISPKSRPNSIEVSYANKDDYYKKDTVKYEDHTAIEANVPKRSLSMNLFGATRQSQLYREGRFHVLAYKYQDEQIATKQGIDFIHCKPGDVIRTQHDVPAWGQGGRIKSATIDSITLDKEVEIAAGTYTITVIQKDVNGLDTLETRTVVEGTGFYTTLHVTVNFSAIPETWGLWTLGKTTCEPKLFRMVQTKHTPENEVELLASEYSVSAYTDTGVVLQERIESGLPNPFEVKNVTNLSVVENGNILGDGSWAVYLVTGFQKPEYQSLLGWDHAEIWISLTSNSGWEHYGDAKKPGYKIDSHDFLKKGNTVYIKAISSTANGTRATWESAPITSKLITGKTTPPSDVTGFEETQYSDRVVLNWDMPTDADVRAGGYFEIRQGETWGTAEVIQSFIKSNTYTWLTFVPGETTLLIKAVDSSGNYSANAASINFIINILPTGLAEVNVDALKGVTCTNTLLQYAIEGHDRAVSLKIASKWDSAIDWDDGTHWDKTIDPLTGYFVTAPIDTGSIARYQWVVEDKYIEDGDGQTATVEIATSENGTDWTGYVAYSVATIYYSRYAKFKVTLGSDNANENIFCYQLSIRAYNADTLSAYSTESGVSPNKITSICIRDDGGNEIILSTVIS